MTFVASKDQNLLKVWGKTEKFCNVLLVKYLTFVEKTK